VLKRYADRPGRSGRGLDAMLLKECKGTRAHSAGQHDLRALARNERGDLARLVAPEVWIFDRTDRADGLAV
jgi:hypothetical protein